MEVGGREGEGEGGRRGSGDGGGGEVKVQYYSSRKSLAWKAGKASHKGLSLSPSPRLLGSRETFWSTSL